MLVNPVILRPLDPHEPPKQVKRPPPGAARPHEPITIFIKRQRMTAGKPPLDIKVDQRKHLRVIQLGGQRWRIGVFAHASLQLGIAQEARNPPFLLPLIIQHIPLGYRLGQPAQGCLERVHIVGIIPDHQAKGPRINQMHLPGRQRVISVQQQHIAQLALQQRQLARHMDRRHVFLHRPAPQCACQPFLGNIRRSPLGLTYVHSCARLLLSVPDSKPVYCLQHAPKGTRFQAPHGSLYIPSLRGMKGTNLRDGKNRPRFRQSLTQPYQTQKTAIPHNGAPLPANRALSSRIRAPFTLYSAPLHPVFGHPNRHNALILMVLFALNTVKIHKPLTLYVVFFFLIGFKRS